MNEEKLWTSEEVEQLLEVQRGNCYVSIYNDNPENKKIASICVNAPLPANFKSEVEKEKNIE